MYNQEEIWSKKTFSLFYKWFTVEVIISVLAIVSLIFGVVQYKDVLTEAEMLTFVPVYSAFLLLWIWRLKAVGALFYRFRPAEETK